jgi:hypothetical protein
MSEVAPRFDLKITIYLNPEHAWYGFPGSEIKLTGALDVLQAQTFTVGGIVQSACTRIVVNQITKQIVADAKADK